MEAEPSFKRKSKRFRLSQRSRKRMRSYFSEYCENTSIHGLKYLGEPNRSCLERLWWLLTISACVFICGYLILKTWGKWERSPVIVSFATKQMPIFDIPFPAVTICPEVKSDKTKFDYTDLLKQIDTLTGDEKMYFEYMSLICDPNDINKANMSDTVGVDVLNFFDDVKPSFNETGVSCEWLGENVDCQSLFKPIFTDEGVCYTYNMLDREEIFTENVVVFQDYFKTVNSTGYTLEGGYNLKQPKNTYPRRALYPGAKAGLSVKLKSLERNLEYKCGNSLQGFKVLLHHPTEIPRVSQQYFRLPLDQAVVAALTPGMISTTSELRGYDADKRQCYFPKERQLAFFKIYTQKNCELECLRNYTLRYCHCVDFHMPRSENVTICGPRMLNCMREAERILLSKEIDILLEARKEENNSLIPGPLKKHWMHFVLKQPEDKKVNKDTCNCLPSCTSITYDAETSQTEWHWEKVKRNYTSARKTKPMEFRREHHSLLIIYFKDTQFIPSERDELYGHTDFLANCGGLLGLFTGFSFLSFVEIIYFLTLRLCCNIRLYGRKFWHGSENLN